MSTADRPAEPGRGPRLALVTLYSIFALAATSRGVVQIATKFHVAPLAYLLSLLSGIIYIAATVGLTARTRWSARLAWVAVSTELLGVLVIGSLSIGDRAAFPDDTVWSQYGSGYGYVPLVLPMAGLAWLWHFRRRAHPAPVVAGATAAVATDDENAAAGDDSAG